MATEIERKFLVDLVGSGRLQESADLIREDFIQTIYLSPQIRVRRTNWDDYTLGVKICEGISRQEFEYPCDENLFYVAFSENGRLLSKVRKTYLYNDWVIHLDTFSPTLIIAEIEFRSLEDAESFKPFKWMGEEVTNDLQYYNYALWEKELPVWMPRSEDGEGSDKG